MFQSIKRRIRPHREKIYIVPTKAGAFFIFITLVMLLVGSGYTNNLVNVLAFFMFALIFVAMVLTNVQLKGLVVEDFEILPAFAESAGEAVATLQNNGAERWGIEATLADRTRAEASGPKMIRARQNGRIAWSLKAEKRGRYHLERLELFSVYPLGLFHAWKIVPVDTTYYVYPKLDGAIPMPSLQRSTEGDTQMQNQSAAGDDFKGHRKYLPGDSPRQIDWKAHARGRPLLIKEINEGDPPEQIIDWHMLDGAGLDDETRLSQLAVWVQEVFLRGGSFRLRLPAQTELAGRGIEHASRCFERLASYGAQT